MPSPEQQQLRRGLLSLVADVVSM